jgi:UDP-N-acetylglucosamine 3-dehydrogenase
MSNSKTKIAVIGVGEIGTKAHIPAYLRNENADLVALVDADEKRLKKTAKKFKIKNCFSSIDELLQNQSIDAVSVCTPPTTHAQIVLKALANDIHVLCEKPMATNTDDGKKMLETAQKKEKVLMVGFNLRFQPNYERTARQIKNGCVGHAHFVEFNLQSPNPLVNWSKSPWFFNQHAGGGVLLDKGPHVFDMINYVFDDFPCAVSAVSSTFFQSSVEDSCVCVLEYPGNRIGIGIMSWLPSRGIELLSVYGTSQNLFVSPEVFVEANATDLLEIALFRKATKLLVNLKFKNLPPFKTNIVDTFQLEIDNFVQQVRNGQRDYSSALSGANVLTTCNAAKQSLETGKKVDFVSLRNSEESCSKN